MKYPFILSLLVCCLACSSAGAVESQSAVQASHETLAAQDDAAIFADANHVFDAANKMSLKNPAQAKSLYQDAILKYRFLVDHGRGISPELYANLANAYFFAGDNGHAVLFYHRALELDPMRGDILHNLRYVRSLTVDELPQTTSQRFLHAISFWHRWPFSVQLGLFFLANLLFWGGIARLFYRRTRPTWWLIGLSFTLALVFGLSLLTTYFGWDSDVDGVVIDREVVARQGNGYVYDNAYSSALHAGTEFKLIESRDGWHHVRLLDGSTCWLRKNSCALIKEDARRSLMDDSQRQ